MKTGILKPVPYKLLSRINEPWYLLILLDLSSFTDQEFLDLIFGYNDVASRVSFSNLLDDMKGLFYSHHHTQTHIENLYTYFKLLCLFTTG